MSIFTTIFGITVAAMLSLISLTSNFNLQHQPPTESSFPLQPGTVWVYRGIVRWYDFQSQKTVGAHVTCRVEVLRMIHREGLVAAVVRGFPADFDWSEGETVQRDWLFIKTARDEWHWFGGEDVEKNLRRLEDSSDSLEGMLTVDDLLMKLPLRKGMKFCDAESKVRPDDHYCWVVASVRAVDINNIKGVDAGRRNSFLLQYVTNPDDTEFEFVPGIGFTSYRYHHHGSVADTEMNLVEFLPSKNEQTDAGLKR